MGVSFKIARVGSRYRPRIPPVTNPPNSADGDAESAAPLIGDRATDPPRNEDAEVSFSGLDDKTSGFSHFTTMKGNKSHGTDHEASFSLNLYPNGFFIGKPIEGMLLPLLQDIPELLHPYDRASKLLFSAIENGWLPGDIFDDLPCKYNNGTLFCEIWDFRSSMSKLEYKECNSSCDEFPKVQKVCLRMGFENVVKDMHLISNASWTYNDLLQVESQIIKFLNPKLYLSTKPSLDRLCKTSASELDLGIFKRRLTTEPHDKPEFDCEPVTVDHLNRGVIENLKPQTSDFPDGALSCAQNTVCRSTSLIETDSGQNSTAFTLASQPCKVSDIGCSVSNTNISAVVPSVLFPPDKNRKDSFLHTRYNATCGKRNQFHPESARSSAVKRQKNGLPISDPPQQVKNSSPGPEDQNRVNISQKQQDIRVSEHVDISNQPCHPKDESSTIIAPEIEVQMISHLSGAEKNTVKEKPTETKVSCSQDERKGKEECLYNVGDKKSRQQLSFRKFLSHPQCDNDLSGMKQLKENTTRKRKLTKGSQVSSDSLHQSQPFHFGRKQRASLGTPRSVFPEVSDTKLRPGDSIVDHAASVETGSVTSASNSSLKDANGISNPASTTATCIHGISNSSLTGIVPPPPPALSEANNVSALLERFSKIGMITQRYGLNSKKNKVDNHLNRKLSPRSLLPPVRFLVPEDSETGASKNTWKTRMLTYKRAQFFFTGNSFPFLASESWCKLVLARADELSDHQVVAEIFYLTEGKHFHVALLPTHFYADLFSAQFTSLMENDGYELVNDQLMDSSFTTYNYFSGSSIHNGSSGFRSLPITTAEMDHSSRITTPTVENAMHFNQFPPQKFLLPTAMPSFNLTRPPKKEFPSDASFMQQQISNGLKSMPLHEKILNSPGLLPLMPLQQCPRQSHGILQNNAATVKSAGDIVGAEHHVSSATLKQISATNNSCFPFINKGTVETTQAIDVAKIMQMQKLGMDIDLAIRHLSNGSGSTLTGASLRTNVYPFQGRGKSPLLFNKPSTESCNSTYLPQHQLPLDPRQSLLNPHQLHQMGTQQRNVPVISQSREATSVGHQQFLRVEGRQVGSSIANIGSPQLSAQTVGSAGSITNSPVDSAVVKEDNINKDTV
ncbi:hypothetical protein Cni_G11599 [Canna indica]|uniref:Uncharacterized protein n=1 Tax=Canna indica TaxID=4628 RepID=A0AAQ3QBW6_9LILI|nr:hypothetical protein Cni_G11599 [Canna indica]